jgi:hypothetical protein
MEMSTPAYANTAGGGGTGIVQADTETLPEVAAQWRALLPSFAALPRIPAYPDPASSAAASAMADWPAIQAARIANRQAAADTFVAAVDKTSTAFAATDRCGAGAISSSVEPTLV